MGTAEGTQAVPQHPTKSRCLTGWLGRRARCQEQQGARRWQTGSEELACSEPDWIQEEEGCYSSLAGGWMQQGLLLGPQQEKAQLLLTPSLGYEKARLEQPCLQVSAARGCGHQQQSQTPPGRVQACGQEEPGPPGLRACDEAVVQDEQPVKFTGLRLSVPSCPVRPASRNSTGPDVPYSCPQATVMAPSSNSLFLTAPSGNHHLQWHLQPLAPY